MAYNSRALSVLAYANGFTLWHYATPDAAAVVDTNGYFNAAVDMLRQGDMIMANVAVGGTQAAGIFVVRSRTATTVDVANITPFGDVNTD